MQRRIIAGKYEIVRELSKGGMGAVYEARHVLTRRKVALKLILAETLARRSSDALRRFEREARAAGSIESRHVVSLLDTGVDSTTNDHYIVMELLAGEDLRQLIHRAGTLPPRLVLAIASQTCVGLRRAHEQGIIHRDIKSANIFLARRDDGQVEVKILDFGIAKLQVDPLASEDGHDLTRSGSVLGSPLYMSPEQATGSRLLDARSDLWSLGIVMYEALTGAPPHANQALGAVILAICSEPARPIRERAPRVPPELAAIVHRAIALEPSERFASAEQMQAALDALLPAGSNLSESELRSLPDGAAREPPLEPPAGASGEPRVAQTTVDAVTYGSGATHGKTRGRGAKRALAVATGLAALVATLSLLGRDVGPPTDAPPGVPSAAGASAPAPPRMPAAQPVPPADLVVKRERPAVFVAPSAPSTPRPEKPRATRRSAEPPAPAPRPASSSPPARAERPVADEPEIDRRFE